MSFVLSACGRFYMLSSMVILYVRLAKNEAIQPSRIRAILVGPRRLGTLPKRAEAIQSDLQIPGSLPILKRSQSLISSPCYTLESRPLIRFVNCLVKATSS